ncbi:dTDP-glucose 4,6-dehydratase [Indibacter alkaliphilus LW1]|uniref:dTDP-glucose 4,6-dehydratase n=1 Tax=Indibacter alkaliphilus (strain CCUG 57479 / KCTC 22604 / LW1) TaxID=1189612 RepID=S2D891_INDAL|nr:NAD-dependent epimerase [Indibacter alkaliphilus]EOZ95119.1 dTDP-glucose 4,6-dehydratase [Indibacter alkaliphilus LW1]
MKYLITGTAGFIGFHLSNLLLERGDTVIGIDNINDYYDVNLKFARLEESGISKGEIKLHSPVKSVKFPEYTFIQMDLSDKQALMNLFETEKFDVVINLAAQAGVRYSLINPAAYIDTNVTGFVNILEACRAFPVKHLVYASSSSVYGANTQMPFSTSDNVDHPLSLYAASKKSNELMAHTYSHLFNIPTTGLRFFTVYGPWGRPDMALFLFIEAITKNEPIQVFNHGKMKRDFTYVGDIVEGIKRVADKIPEGNPDWSGDDPDPGSSYAPYKVYNIGNSSPVELMDYIGALEKALGKEAKKEMLPLQPGDVPATFADVTDLMRDTGYKPDTPVEEGVARFVTWYNEFYKKH